MRNLSEYDYLGVPPPYIQDWVNNTNSETTVVEFYCMGKFDQKKYIFSLFSGKKRILTTTKNVEIFVITLIFHNYEEYTSAESINHRNGGPINHRN